ncbi:FecR family protein, partial [Pseudanabaena sp. FACHB-2040]|uniref:FecR family protein n=1 Tax=Pseudanabaena sp. FACHB-2040 TaxID=2692859 RepID=UPI001685B565
MLSKQVIAAVLCQRLTQIAGLALLTSALLLPSPAKADVALTRADINALLNRVELIPRGRSARPARVSDFLGTGDALRTAAASRAELRFNDGSLARVGERATFRFTPNTRNFRLTNGTVLLLVPPGRGRTTIQTPNAVTGIQGSALVVRHIPGQNMTIVMALTNNPAGPMTVTTQDGVQTSALYAGQMALIQPNRIEVIEFDLNSFHQTSDLMDGLNLSDESFEGNADDPLHAVREETIQALSEQTEFANDASPILNPVILSIDSSQDTVVEQPWILSPVGSVNGVSTDAVDTVVPPGVLASSDEPERPHSGPGLPTVPRADEPVRPEPSPPGTPGFPGKEPPSGPNNPGPNNPGPNNPGPNNPGPNNPGPNNPGPNNPGPNNPGPNNPGPNNPGPNNPGPNNPGPNNP